MPARAFPQPSERYSRLTELRRLKMARDAHAFVRGSTQRFYEWLATESAAKLPVGPAIWICGDCHVGNLGPIGGVAGGTQVEIRDLDQTTIGNPAHDVVRLALSLAMAARGSSLPGVVTAQMTEHLVAGYEDAFGGVEPREELASLPSPVRYVMKRALRRTWKHVVKERLGKRWSGFRLGRRFWPLSDGEREAVEQLVATPHVHGLITRLSERANDANVELLDAAYWIKGCSSLGLWRAAVLVQVTDDSQPKGARVSRHLLDLKEATMSTAPTLAPQRVPANPADRVVMGAVHVAPALGARMIAAQVLDHPVFIRELLPQDLKIELDTLTVDDARGVARYFGAVVGDAHARQLDPADRDAWAREMAGRRKKSLALDAPGWLWEALVDLVGVHEHAYLEHCRRFVLEGA